MSVGVGERHLLLGATVAGGGDQVLVGAVAGGAGCLAEMDQVAGRYRQVGADLLDGARAVRPGR